MMSSNQNLRRDLQGLAADLKWSAVELVRIAERLSQAGNEPDAQALHRMIAMVPWGRGPTGHYRERHLKFAVPVAASTPRCASSRGSGNH